MKSKSFATACAAVALGTMVWAVAQAANQMHAQPTAVAVANVQKIFNSLKERTQIQATMKSQMQDLQNEQEAKKKKIQNLKKELDLLQAGSKPYAKKAAQLDKALIDLKVWAQYQQKKVSQDRSLKIEQLYRQTIKAIANVAKTDGYQLVIYGGNKVNFQYNNENQLATQIQTRKVLWAADSIDITGQVIQQMNNDNAFKNAGS